MTHESDPLAHPAEGVLRKIGIFGSAGIAVASIVIGYAGAFRLGGTPPDARCVQEHTARCAEADQASLLAATGGMGAVLGGIGLALCLAPSERRLEYIGKVVATDEEIV